jgi:predicted permease
MLLNDFRYAARQLRRAPGFTLTAVITLALGLGASAAVYCVIHTVLLSPLPYPAPDRLVGIAFSMPQEQPNAEQAGTTADFVRLHSTSFSSVAILDDGSPAVNLSVNGGGNGEGNGEGNGGRAMQVYALGVSEGYFRTLGTQPVLGRAFTTEEDTPGAARTAILSDGLWTRVFNRDPSIVGRTIRINEDAVTVVGVMPAGFHANAETAPGVLGTPDLWLPLQLGPNSPGYDGQNWQMIGRLRAGVTLAQARLELKSLEQGLYDQYPDYRRTYSGGNMHNGLLAWPLKEVVVTSVRRSLFTVMGAVLAVLLVACLNLAGLMMARTMRRSREIAMRSALGATRAQLVRLLAAEGLLLAVAGGLLGIGVARAASLVLLHATPMEIPQLADAPGNGLIAAVIFALALVSTAIFSLLPALVILRRRSGVMRLGGPSLGQAISHARLSRALLIAQIALAMVLVSTASVLMGTFVKLQALPAGVQPKQLTVFQVDLKGDHYATTQHTTQFVTTVLDQLRRTPGVDSVAAINGLPLDRGLNIGGHPSDRPHLGQIVEFRAVTPGYFRTMGIPVLAGRDIDQNDRAGGDLVVLIGATAARKWWPERSPIGDLISVQGEEKWRIVGVVADVQMHSLQESQGVVIYAPMAQLGDHATWMVNGWFPTSFAMRTAAHINVAQAAQRAVERADTQIPVSRLATMQEVIDSTIDGPRFFSLLAAGFSAFALVLTVIGLFGLLSYQVAQRTREIGVRMALGADRLHILRTFLGRGLAVAAAGVAIGLVATWMIRPVIAHLLSDAGVDTTGPTQSIVMKSVQAALLAVSAIFAVTLAASWLPAHRAAHIEPMQALRTE